MKNKLFDILDTARDLQNDVESAQDRIERNAKKMRRYLDKRAMWKYQLKYSLGTTKACVTDGETVEDRAAAVMKHYEAYSQEMLPKLIEGTLATLKASHTGKGAQCKAIAAKKNPEPTKPKGPVGVHPIDALVASAAA
jgi:hypothetical protein